MMIQRSSSNTPAASSRMNAAVYDSVSLEEEGVAAGGIGGGGGGGVAKEKGQHHKTVEGFVGKLRGVMASVRGGGGMQAAAPSSWLALSLLVGFLVLVQYFFLLQEQETSRQGFAEMERRLQLLQDHVDSLSQDTAKALQTEVSSFANRISQMEQSAKEEIVATLREGHNSSITAAAAADAGKGGGVVEESSKKLLLDVVREMEEIRSGVEELEAEMMKKGKGGMKQQPIIDGLLAEDHPGMWRQHKVRKYGAYGFIRYSSYRVSPSRFVSIGLGLLSRREKREASDCWWMTSGGDEMKGTLRAEAMDEHHDHMYEFLVLFCDLESETQESGGYLRAIMDGEEMFLFREKKEQRIRDDDPSAPPPSLHVAFCGAPMYGELEPAAIVQWMNYHRYVAKIDHYFFYDGGAVSEAMMELLKPWKDEGLLTVTDMRRILQFQNWMRGQAVVMHDCFYRNRWSAVWVMFQDFDEYLEVPPPATVRSILDENADKPFVTHGCHVFSIAHCSTDEIWGSPAATAVEVLRQRWDEPYCTWGDDKNFCVTHHGHRKYFVQPTKAELLYIHQPGVPNEGGVEMSVESIRHGHFQGLHVKGRACHGRDEPDHKWVQDFGIATLGEAARLCAEKGFDKKDNC